MRASRLSFLMIAALFASAAGAEDFDGSKAMECLVQKGHDCLPDKNQCERLKPEGGKKPVLGIDVAAKEVKSPYRTNMLPITNVSSNKDHLVLQGTDLQFAWSAVIHRTTGQMTVALADKKGSYVLFGQCKIAAAPASAQAPAS